MQEIFIKRGWVNLEDCPRANRAAISGFELNGDMMNSSGW
jgi:hypothetical protein